MNDLTFIGVGGAFAVELGGNCAYLKDGNTLLLVDCCEDATIKLKNNNAFDGVENLIIAITHTHADHVAGLGTLIWQCNSIFNIRPKIVSNSNSFELHLRQLMKLLGVEEKLFEFVGAEAVQVDGCKIEMQPTTHTPILEAFGIMFSDSKGKYYYTGDTNDFQYVKELALDEDVKRIYCEVSRNAGNVHLVYDRLKEIKSNKLVLMHFENIDLYNLAKTDGFNVAVIS
ncbi:MAG: MBL fold metallo-hydrolase [Clostridia bacterium]|nr:MBL fold metallo-hydrolase [Clostridia bacterium]